MIAARYRIVDLLGRGGLGAVYRVEHLQTGETFAMKVLLDQAKNDPQALARFRREAKVSAKVRDPHIVRVIDADMAPELGGRPFFVMDLLEGADLERFAAVRGPLDPAIVVGILSPLASALAKAHELGIVHRDLKPENLFLHAQSDGEPIPKILDFGISKMLTTEDWVDASHRTSTGSVIGTPLYMSPEQAEGKNQEIGPWTDVWAMGLVAMRLLMGETYWQPATMAELMLKLVSRPMVPPSERWPDSPRISPELDVWFMKSCARDPRERWPSVVEQAIELAQALGVASPLRRSERAQPVFAGLSRHTPSSATDRSALGILSTLTQGTVAAAPATGRTPGRDEAVVAQPSVSSSATSNSRRWRTYIGAGVAVLAIGSVTAFAQRRAVLASMPPPVPITAAVAPSIVPTTMTTATAIDRSPPASVPRPPPSVPTKPLIPPTVVQSMQKVTAPASEGRRSPPRTSTDAPAPSTAPVASASRSVWSER